MFVHVMRVESTFFVGQPNSLCLVNHIGVFFGVIQPSRSFVAFLVDFFLKVNTARESPAVKFIKGKRGNKLTYMANVSAPWGAAHRPRPMGEEKTNYISIYLTN
jgi:hypothetical protein